VACNVRSIQENQVLGLHEGAFEGFPNRAHSWNARPARCSTACAAPCSLRSCGHGDRAPRRGRRERLGGGIPSTSPVSGARGGLGRPTSPPSVA